MLISPFICSFFFLSNGNFCHRFLSSFWSLCFKILCTLSGWQSVLCKWKLRCWSSFSLLFSIFYFFLLSLFYNTYGHLFLSKISQQLLELWFWNMVQSLIVISVIVLQKTATYCLSVPLFIHFSFSPMKISVTDFSVPIGASVFKFCVHLQIG